MTEKTGVRGWVQRHKKLTIVLAVVLAVAVVLGVVRSRAAKAVQGGMAYQYVRTTTLNKTTLSEAVTVNGTVKSGSEATVTVEDAAKIYKVAAVNVAVGDQVKKGDVIATLDTTEVEKQIAKAEENHNDSLSSAQKSYDQTLQDYTTELADLQKAVDEARQKLDTLGLDQIYESMVNEETRYMTNREKVERLYYQYAERVAGQQNTITNLQVQLTQAQKDGNADRMAQVQQQLTTAQEELNIMKGQCNLSELGLNGFDMVKTYFDQIEPLKQALENAEKNYERGATNQTRSLENAAEKVKDAQENNDTLDDLHTTLDNCTLTATMDGTVTALNATVGAACTGSVATIQDLNDLTVEVTIANSDVPRLSPGMACRITSDATGDAVINGTLTRIDPVANAEGSFGATVTVYGDKQGLLVGIQAKVEIVIQEKNDIFTVPRDAVGTAEDGSSYVLRSTGGTGVDMTFEQVPVTTGEANDYYIEISGETLQEGDVIRASSDLSEGVESTNTENLFGAMMGGSGPVTVEMSEPGGGHGGNRPNGGPNGGPGGMA